MSRLDTVSRMLSVICNSVASAMMILMTIVVFAETVSRYVFGVSHEYIPDISAWLMVWMTYFILGVAIKTREHINVDILQTKLTPKYRVLLFTFFDLMTLIFAVLLFVGGLQYDLMVKAANIHTVSVQSVPMWIVRTCIPLGCAFLVFFSIEHLVKDTRSILNRGPKEK